MKKILLLLAAVALAGCAANLQPAPSSQAVAGLEKAAVSNVAGVRMVAQSGEWPGKVPIADEVTPVRVIIENSSGQPLRISYNLFALVAPAGQRFSALPPYRIEGSVAEPALAPGYGPIGAPGFGYSGFQVAPYYGGVYPGIAPYGGPFYTDPFYYNNYYRRWRTVELPTTEMLQRVLPEGVLNSGGRADGYLYFEKVNGAPRVAFRADLVNAETGNSFGEIRIPFVVD